MKKMNKYGRIIGCVVVLLLTCTFSATAQQRTDTEWWTPPEQVFRPEALDQMLAPIALYPDTLLAQVLASATYPRGIVSADRFASENPRARGEDLFYAARNTDWPPSVKAMLQFPEVLAMMSRYMDWTTKLGNAFLTQQSDVMDSIQHLRQKAYEQGRLITTREAVVRHDARTYTIFIEPANPHMVYVPVYDPTIVYGTWRYPDYPPQRYYYPSYSSSSAASFLAGILVGVARGWGGWDLDWSHHRSNVHVDNYNTFVRGSYASPEWFQISSDGGRTVANDTQFRRNAGYRDYTTAQRLGMRQVSGQTANEPNASGPRAVERAQARPSDSTVGTEVMRNEKPSPAKTELKDGAERRSSGRSSATEAGRPAESLDGKQSDKAATGSEVSQAAHAAQAEGLKGNDLAEKVHEAIDTRQENKDAMKVDDNKKAEEPKEKVKKEKDLKKQKQNKSDDHPDS